MINLLISLLFLYLPFQIALNPREGIDLASVRVIIPLIFLIWLISGLKNKRISISGSIVTFLILSFLFLSIFSLATAGNIDWGMRKILFFLSIFPLYFIVSGRKIASVRIFKFLAWGAFLSASVGIVQFFLQFFLGISQTMALWGKIIVPFLGDSFSEAVIENSSWLVNAGGITLFRAVSFFPDPHMFSFYLGMSAFPVLALYFANAKHRHIYLILFFVILFADLLTFSRGGYLGMSAGLIVFIAIISAKGVFLKKIIANKYLLSSIFSAVFIFLAIPNPIAERLYSSFDLSEGSNSQRLTIWKNSWDMIKKNPLTGVGLGNYSLELKPSADYREPIYSHNAYMDIAAETGLVNASVFLLILFLSIYNSIKIFNRDNNFIYLGIASSITVFSFHSVFETAIFSVHVLPLFALFAGMANAQNNERRN